MLKRTTSWVLSVTVVLAAAAAAFTVPPQAYASSTGWQQKGINISSHWNGDFGSTAFKQAVDNAAADNVNYISLIIPYYQSNLYSTDIQAGSDTPTDSALAAAIDYIHSKGMHVMLNLHLESYTGEWRAYINPGDRTTWFNNYGQTLVHYGQLGQAHGAEDFCIGTELIDMSTASANSANTQNWYNIIGQLRSVFSGRLTYSANWGPGGFTDEKNNIQFWNALDYIGISAYYNLDGDSSVANLEGDWDSYNNSDIRPLSQRWNKPVVFTEIGYKSVTGAHTQPWNSGFGGSYDGQEQANDYQALFDYWGQQGFMQGVELWDWNSDPNAGWPGDTNYTPQHKPAEQIMQTSFAGGIRPVSQTYGTPDFTASASANPGSAAAGQPVNIAATVTNSGQTAGDFIVDTEIYNNSNQRVFQKFYDNQMFNAGQSQTYNMSWTLPDSNRYTIKIGIFSGAWSQLYDWNDSAGTINGSGSSDNPNPPPSNNSPPPNNTAIIYVNGYPTVNGSYIDCNGNIDNDPAHHTTNSSDTDPAHRVGQNCPAGSFVATH